jgi:predicted regulator of Ras-like GTPase activity (Roadblock/LC7/MglB family)
LDQVFIRGERGYVVLMSIGAEAVLTALTRREARLGVIFLDMRRTAAELSRLI